MDNAATTQCDFDAAQVALEIMTQEYGNPSSLHQKGIRAQMRLDIARTQIANALGCASEEVIFTASGTEANNMAVFGAALARRRKGGKIVAMSALHSSIIRPLEKLEEFAVTLVDPQSDGCVDAQVLIDKVDDTTSLLLLEYVNGEVGAIHPIEEICRLARRQNPDIYIHCDGVQAFGKVPFVAKRLGVDSLSVSCHKIYGPKGCGALYLRKGSRILPLMLGGGQEKGMRSGTENTPAICAFGLAAQKAKDEYTKRLETVSELRKHFVNKAVSIPGTCMNSPANATPYINNLSVPKVKSETMLHFLAQKGVYVSSGSACSKGAASRVLTAMGLSRERIDTALRVSLSPRNTVQELDIFFTVLEEGIRTLATP